MRLEPPAEPKGAELRAVLDELQPMGVLTYSGSMIYLGEAWAAERFGGKGRPGLATLEDKIDTWRPVLDTVTEVLRAP